MTRARRGLFSVLLALLCGASLDGLEAAPSAHWLFDARHVENARVKDLAGSLDAAIEGPVRLRPDFSPGALLINRELNRVVAGGLDADASPVLPRKDLTVEAWVAIEKTVEWGSIVAAAPGDADGDDAEGWQLGFRQSSFSFGVAGQGDADRTYARSRSSLEWGAWYHVVGTYDGEEQRLYVNGRLEGSTSAEKGAIRYAPRTACVIGANGSFRPRLWVHEVRIQDVALAAEAVAAAYRAKRDLFTPPLAIAVGPLVERLDARRVRISWVTERPCASAIAFGDSLPLGAVEIREAGPQAEHAVTIDGLERDTLYHYRIFSGRPGAGAATGARSSRLFELDSTFDYTIPAPVVNSAAYTGTGPPPGYAGVAASVLSRTPARRGYCLILGCDTGQLAYEIARRTQLSIVCVDDDDGRVAATRERLDAAGLYGIRVSVHRVDSLEKLPYADYTANLVLSERSMATGELPTPASEVLRVVRPCGGIAWIEAPAGPARERLAAWIDAGKLGAAGGVSVEIAGDGARVVIERGPLPGGGSWTHQYGDAGNSACSQDELVSGPMRVLWFGRPGPRPMVDRGTRAPAPLSVNGRLFVQGDRRLFGLDAYNGTILWTLEIPNLRRANVPRDSSNMAATDDSLYVAVGGRCLRLDARSGERLAAFGPPPEAGGADAGADGARIGYDWGFLACSGDTLYGSVVRRGGLYIGADGEWYDRRGDESMKVVSDGMFALDRRSGATKWVRRGGLVINSTLSMGDGRLYLVESRNPSAQRVGAGRLGDELRNDRYLVALDARSGKDLWEKYYDFDEGRFVFYLAYAKDTLVALSTSDRYHLYAFDAAGGDLLWKKSYGWNRDHHGGAMQHPVIVDDTIYAEPNGFGLRTGELVRANLPARSGCGAMSGSKGALFFRDGDHSMWDLEADRRERFSGIRPGCWLGIINAGGIVLAPESSAGCYCANPLQTSIAFYPVGEE